MANYQTTPSSFPGGFNNVTIRGIPITQSHPGQVFWVNNGANLLTGQTAGADGNPGTFQSPLATLSYALLNKCVGGRGDIVFVKPGHSEKISSSTAMILSASGVAVVGLGIGTSRPLFTLDTATGSTFNIQGDNMSFVNCRFVSNFLNVASLFVFANNSFTGVIDANGILTASAVTGTIRVGQVLNGTGVLTNTVIESQISGTVGGAGLYNTTAGAAVTSTTMTSSSKNFTLDNCDIMDTSNIKTLLNVVTTSATANAADGLNITNNTISATSAAGVCNILALGAAVDRVTINGNYYSSLTTDTGAAMVVAGANAMTNFKGLNNIFNLVQTTGTGTGLLITSSTTIQGVLGNNWDKSLANGTVILSTASTGLNFVNNLHQDAADTSGFLLPTADS